MLFIGRAATLAVLTAALFLSTSIPAFADDPPATDDNVEFEATQRPDHDGDGIPNGQDPDWTGSENSAGPGFVDADGNGECDRLEAGEPGAGGAGKGWKRGNRRGGWGKGWKNGQGRGMRWVDQDGDGVCDQATEVRDCGRGRGLPPCGAGGTDAR